MNTRSGTGEPRPTRPAPGPELPALGHEPPGTGAVGNDWVVFPGGELEGRRPKALCAACRDRLKRASARGDGRPGATHHLRFPATLCFQCYRAELDREGAIRAAGQVFTASPERFQNTLPFEPVNHPRLERLRAERATVRATMKAGVGRFEDRRRQAQIAARRALQTIATELTVRQVAPAESERAWSTAIHAAELQLPESWLPFVVSR